MFYGFVFVILFSSVVPESRSPKAEVVSSNLTGSATLSNTPESVGHTVLTVDRDSSWLPSPGKWRVHVRRANFTPLTEAMFKELSGNTY